MESLLSPSGWLPGSKPRFIALLPPVPTIRFRSEPRFPTNDSLAEFGHHIVTSLHDYSDTVEEKDLSAAFTTEPLALFNQHAINRAIQDLARESAVELARSLVPRLKAKFEDRVVTANPERFGTNVTLENSGATQRHVNDTTAEHSEAKDHASRDKANQETGGAAAAALPELRRSDDPGFKGLAEQAKPLESQANSEFQVDSMLSQLALHDIIVLADDFKSADWSKDRVLATQAAIQEIFRIATIKTPHSGIELHFSNDSESTGTTYFGSEDECKNMIKRLGLRQGGAVACPLQEKILKPLAERIGRGSLQNPIIVVIVTGGGALQENAELAKTLGDAISNFRDHLIRQDTTPTVSFIFLAVGNDKHTGSPFGSLEQDGRIQDMVRCHKNHKRETFPSQLVELFADVLDTGRG